MSINKKILITASIGIALGVSSCKKFLNVNTNPNVAQTATMQTLLPAAQLYVGTASGVDLEIDGSIWAQFWTQSPSASQYHILETYNPGQDVFSFPWSNLYTANENFYQLYKLADTLKSKQYKAISLLMQAYTFQLITDGWGDAPFTTALKGQFADGHLVNPKYDSQMVVYNGILAYIDSANALLSTTDPIHPGADDLIYGGNMGNWQKFSNTLQLRVLLRMSSINQTAAQTGITALYATSPAFIGDVAGDDAFIPYGFNTSNKSPLYAEESSTTLGGVQNLVGSKTCIDSMVSNGDPRMYVFYSYIAALGIPVGVAQGYTGNITAGSYSIPNVYVAGDAQNAHATANFTSANAPVNLLTSWESKFLQAEVAARGWGPGDDQALYYAGILASFNYYSKQLADVYGSPATSSIDSDYLTGALNGGAAGYWTVYPTGGSPTQKLRFIITQKWFAMCGNQGFEAWTEWRRTGYPDFFVQSLSAGALPKPRRFLYPTSESTTNASYPGLAPIASPVWWDII